MEQSDEKRNVVWYWLYVTFNEHLWWGPILITCLEKLAHMRLAEIYYMESVVLCLCVALDIPAGALADVIGRKKCVITGRLFILASAFFFTTMTTPLHAWIGNILWAIGFSLQSGADTALLYETLTRYGRQSEYKKIEGRAIGSRFIVTACCSLTVGLLANSNLRLPLWIGLPFMSIPLVAAFFLKEPGVRDGYSAKKQLATLAEGWLHGIRSVHIRWIIGFTALLAMASKVWFFSYNPYFELVGLPLTQYGIIFFCLNVTAWFSSHYAYRVDRYLDEQTCVIGMVLCISVPILLMGCIPILPFAYLVVLQNVVRGFMRPFVLDYLNRHSNGNVRATVLSIQSSAAHITSIIGLALFGLVLNPLGLLCSLILLGVIALAIGIGSYLTYPKRVR